jgi:hypothetical protein
LDVRDPWLKLEGFFPFPKPVYGTLQRQTLLPVPFYYFFKDQLEEINELTARISGLCEALRLKGFYTSDNSDIKTAIEKVLRDNGNRATMVPVSSFAAMSGGKLSDAIVWLPLGDVAAAITSCIEIRKQLIDDVYQITGLSDIMRGSTNPNETLGAQELKSQYGSVRIRESQNEMIRIARDCAVIAGEIISENFDPQTIVDAAQMQIPTEQDVQGQIQTVIQQAQQKAAQAMSNPEIIQQAQANPQAAQQQAMQLQQQVEQQIAQMQKTVTVEKVAQLLRDQRMRPFALEIETDSTIQPNEDAEKQRRTEYLTSVGGFINQVAPTLTQFPPMANFAAEALKFVSSTFRAGRSLDGAIDELSEGVKQMAQQPKPPSPEEVKAKADEAKMQNEMAMKKEEHGMKIQMMEAEKEQKQQEHVLKREEMAAQSEARKEEHAFAKTKHESDMNDRTLDRSHKTKMAENDAAKARMDAGIPDGYSFEDDRKQFGAIVEMMARSEQSNAQVLQTLSQAIQNQEQQVQTMVKAFTAPRRMKGPSGKEYYSETVVQ